MVSIICKCGNGFERKKDSKSSFCSKECRYKYGGRRKSKQEVYYICKCGKEFKTFEFKIRVGKGIYCSKACMYKYSVRPTGLTYVKHKENPTSFKVGHNAWNKGLAGLGICKPNIGSIKKGERRGVATEFKIGEFVDNKNQKWKGDDVGYSSLHEWVKRRIEKPNSCAFCGVSGKRIELANKSYQYRRDIDDWLWLCKKCHVKYDMASGFWGSARKKFNL